MPLVRVVGDEERIPMNAYVFTREAGGTILVTGSPNGPYTITADPRGARCSCPSRRVCKHLRLGREAHPDWGIVIPTPADDDDDDDFTDFTSDASDDAGPGLVDRDVPPDDEDFDPEVRASDAASGSDVDAEPARHDDDGRRDPHPRRAPPPWVWARIVKMCAAPALTPHHKLIYLEHYSWRVCMVSASALGRRLGISVSTVERDRKDLRRWGLLSRHDRGEGRVQEWRLELPPRCRPQGRRITDDDAERYAEMLKAHIGALGPPSTQTEVRGAEGSETPTSVSPWRRFEHDEGS